MFLQFTPAYGFAFLQIGILPRAVFHKPPGRKTRCGKRTQTVVFHTVFAPAEPSQSPAATAPPRGELFAVTETYRMNDKSFRQRYKLPLRGSWHRTAMTERVGCKNKPSRADKVPERAYKTIFYALAAAHTRVCSDTGVSYALSLSGHTPQRRSCHL